MKGEEVEVEEEVDEVEEVEEGVGEGGSLCGVLIVEL